MAHFPSKNIITQFMIRLTCPAYHNLADTYLIMVKSLNVFFFYSEIFMPNFQDQISVSNIMTDAIWRHTGGRYTSASESNAAGLVSGTSGDYAAGQDRIPLVFSVYTPRGGQHGWDVPADQINRIVEEVFAGVEALALYVGDLPLPDPLQ